MAMLADLSRRQFLKTMSAAGVVTIVGSTTSALVNPLTAWAVPGGADDTVLVSIFLRGAADGLNIVCPHGDPNYYNQRGDYGLGAGAFTDLDGFFGLNNDFAPLAPLFNDGRMAVVQAVGSHLPTRSHFVAQPNMESGLGLGGWLQRAVAASSFAGSAAGLSIGDRTSPQLVGPFAGTTVKTVGQAVESGMNIAATRPAIEALYGAAGVPALEKTAVLGALTTIDQIAGLNPMPGEYPNTSEGRNFREAGSLISADIGVRAVALETTGWDHHSDGIANMTNRGARLSGAIQAFLDDLGSHRERVVIVVSTEFGRTVKPNGSGGTDHGHASMMMVLGDRLSGHSGGQVLTPGGWPGLADGQLYQGRDLAVTTDFRSVYGELAQRHLGVTDLSSVFPGFTPEPVGLLPAPASGDVDGSGLVDNADVQMVLSSNVHGTTAPNADIDGDGDVDLKDALLLAQRVQG